MTPLVLPDIIQVLNLLMRARLRVRVTLNLPSCIPGLGFELMLFSSNGEKWFHPSSNKMVSTPFGSLIKLQLRTGRAVMVPVVGAPSSSDLQTDAHVFMKWLKAIPSAAACKKLRTYQHSEQGSPTSPILHDRQPKRRHQMV